MDKLTHYRECIKAFLRKFAESMKNDSEIAVELIFDNENDHYLLLDIGWRKSHRIHDCIFHFDIKDGKIWLQENNTDLEIDEELEEMGISKDEIVVGFHHPSMRKYSDYAFS
jgi:XisI protein